MNKRSFEDAKSLVQAIKALFGNCFLKQFWKIVFKNSFWKLFFDVL